MRFLAIVLCTAVASATLVAQSPASSGGEAPIVHVGVFKLQPDGSVGGFAVETAARAGEEFASGILSDGCRIGAGQSWAAENMPPWGTDAWRVRGRIVSVTSGEAVVQLDWQRVRSSGAAVQPPTEYRQLVLPVNQLLILEPVEPSADPSCAQRPVVFGARYAPSLVPPGQSGGGFRRGLSGAGGISGTVGATAVTPFEAELWLVHGVPGQVESVVPSVAPLNNGLATFDFGSVRVPVDGGTFDVRISGQLRIVRPEAATPLLMFRADRVATFTTSGQPPRDRVTRPIRGNAVVMRPWPGPDDVLEFEMPPLGDQGTVAVPDMFSVRVRLRPTNGR